jgi:predicted transcriptional regulator
MKTSLATFEHRVREWLLNLLHNQWRALGVPFIAAQTRHPNEAIDPEALLWCSLEFFPTQPRLCEQVLAWWAGNNQSLLRQRIRKFAQAQPDPRASIWHALDPQWKVGPKQPPGPCYGQKSVEELLEFCSDIGKKAREAKLQRQQPGVPERTPATTILRARDVIGTDARHFLLVYLLANHGAAKLRSVAAWSGQSYRNISKVAQRLEAANIISLEHGYGRLKNPDPWATILELESRNTVLLNWLRFYDACIQLLRSLHKAASKPIPADGPVVTGLIREAVAEAKGSVEGDPSASSGTVQDLTELLASLH